MIRNLYYSKNFYTRSVIYAALSICAAALSYIIYPFLIHLLPREVFGDIGASLALTNQLASLFLAFNIVSLYLSKKYRDSHQRLEHLQKDIVRIFLLFSVLLVAMSPILHDILNFGNYRSFIAVLLLLLLTVPSVIWIGYLQGKEEMARVGIYTFLVAAFKFIFAITLAAIFRSDVALFGIVMGQLAGLIILAKLPGARTPSLRSLFSAPNAHYKPSKQLFSYLLGAVIACGIMSFAQNADILYAKALLQPYTAGTYVAISSLSSVVFHISILLVWIALSGINLKNPSNNWWLAKKTLALISVIFTGIFATFFFSEHLILRYLVGSVPEVFHGQLLKSSLYQFIVAASTLIVYMSLTLREKRPLLQCLGLGLPLLFTTLLYDNNGPQELVNIMLSLIILGFILQCFILLAQRSRGKKDAEIKEIS